MKKAEIISCANPSDSSKIDTHKIAEDPWRTDWRGSRLKAGRVREGDLR